jgi:glucuronokinase
VVQTMAEIAALADAARAALERGDHDGLARIIDRNFDLRRSIFDIRQEDLRMVETARRAGASCKFCGSGGAVVGTVPGHDAMERLRQAMKSAGYAFFAPRVVNGPELALGGE